MHSQKSCTAHGGFKSTRRRRARWITRWHSAGLSPGEIKLNVHRAGRGRQLLHSDHFHTSAKRVHKSPHCGSLVVRAEQCSPP
mmetsp:Transcript_38601/g.70209  ORF Transcript_38601/g.70209 Transcript_38601/m.70209 type:complete len:83 (-) Transcript_38601:2535-2783(-)